MRRPKRRTSMRLDEGDDGGNRRPVLLEEAMRPCCIAGVRARRAGGVDPLDPGLAARPGDETGCVTWRCTAAGILAVMNNERRRQPVRRAQRCDDHGMDAGDKYRAAWTCTGGERGRHIDRALAHADDDDLSALRGFCRD